MLAHHIHITASQFIGVGGAPGFDGTVGIFGKNYSGKSSVIDTLLYTLYNTTSKNERKNVNIITYNDLNKIASKYLLID